MAESIRVFAPASIGNVGCGFDVLGLALCEPGDEVRAALTDKPGVELVSVSGDGGLLATATDQNTATVAASAFLESIGSTQGISIALTKRMPIGSGLGSSAASAVAGVFAANELLGRPLDRVALLPFCVEAERAACGSGHADNVAPSLLGGLVLVRSTKPLDVVSIPVPDGLMCVVTHPHMEIRTRDARAVLKDEVPLKDATQQWANVGALVAGCMKGDFDLIGRSLQDVIAEPRRSALIPGFDGVKSAALAHGALGASISGSGPSVFALCRNCDDAVKVSGAMKSAFAEAGLESTVYVSEVNRAGPRIIEPES